MEHFEGDPPSSSSTVNQPIPKHPHHTQINPHHTSNHHRNESFLRYRSSENISFDGLGDVGEIKLWRGSGLAVVVRVESFEVPHHFRDVDYVSDNRFMLEKNEEQEKKRFNYTVNHLCRHPIPDFYTITLEVARDRATAAQEVSCQSDSGEEKCPDGVKDGEVYLKRSLCSPCSLMGAHPEPLGKEFNSIYCNERNSLLTRIFGKSHSPERSIRFPAKKCRLPIFRCEQCLGQARCSELSHFSSMCCQLDCYALSDCKTTFIDECKNNPVVCGMGDTYRFTLEPMFLSMRNNFSCHVRSRAIEASNDNWVYKIQFHVTIASLGLSSPIQEEIVSLSYSKNTTSFKLQIAFLELEHFMEATLEDDEYILSGHEDDKGILTYHVSNLRREFTANTTDGGFSGAKEQTSSSSQVALVQFDEPFVYSSSTWNTTDMCHKNVSRMMPWRRDLQPPKMEVEAVMERSGNEFHYFIRRDGSPPPVVAFNLKADRSVLAHWFRESGAHLANHSIELAVEEDGVRVDVTGVMSLCPSHLHVTFRSLETSSNHDLLISCPPSFNLSFHVIEDETAQISSYALEFSTDFRNSSAIISLLKVKQVRIPGDESRDLYTSSEDDVKALQKSSFFTAFWLFVGTLILEILMLAMFSLKPKDASRKWIASCCTENQFIGNKTSTAFYERQKRSSESKITQEKIDRHQSPFPGEYSALRPDVGGNWHRPSCDHYSQPTNPNRDHRSSPSRNQKSNKLVLIFHFLFWTVYSFLFTLTVFLSFFVGLLNSENAFIDASTLGIVVQNWTQSVAREIEKNIESIMSERFFKLTKLTNACENHISESYDEVVRLLKIRSRLSRGDNWASLQTPHKKIFDDFISNYSKSVSNFLHPVFMKSVLNLTLGPSSNYQKYLRRVFLDNWFAFPSMLFVKMRQNSSENSNDNLIWCERLLKSYFKNICTTLETNSQFGEFLEVEEIRPVHQWMSLFLTKFGGRFEKAGIVNFSIGHHRNDVGTLSSPFTGSESKLDSRHFIQSTVTSHREESLFHRLFDSTPDVSHHVRSMTSDFDDEFLRVRLVFVFLDSILLVYRISQALLSSYVLVTCMMTEKMVRRCFTNASAVDAANIIAETNDRRTSDQQIPGDSLTSKCESNVRLKDSSIRNHKKIKKSLELMDRSPSKPFLSSRVACRMIASASFFLVSFYSLLNLGYIWRPPHRLIRSALFEVSNIINETCSDHSEEEIDFLQNVLSFADVAQHLEIQNSEDCRRQILFSASQGTIPSVLPCSYISADVYFKISIEDSIKVSDYMKGITSVIYSLLLKFFAIVDRFFLLFSVTLGLMLILNTAIFLLVSSNRKKISKSKKPATAHHQYTLDSTNSKRFDHDTVRQSQCLLPSGDLTSITKHDQSSPKDSMNFESRIGGSFERNTIKLLWNEFKISETHV